MTISRRTMLFGGAACAAAVPLAGRFRRDARAAFTGDGLARRIIFFYFPDGVPGPSQDGQPSLWHPTGSGSSFALPDVLSPLEAHRDSCALFRGLSMGPTDSGSHPGGAKKLLTATDGGNGTSIDQHLAATVGSGMPFRHLCLGAQSNANGAEGDKHVSYIAPGQTASPDDDPLRVFDRVFGDGNTSGSDTPADTSVLDAAKQDLSELRSSVAGSERIKLDRHLDSIRELEMRLVGGPLSCDDPSIDASGLTGDALYAPEEFPRILRAQIDILVQAMACGSTRVGLLQSSHHTSDLIMSRFSGTEMYEPGFDMRSHQASHYGPNHDFGHREFAAFVRQRRWFVEQFAYLLDRLAEQPEADGTMLDYSIAVLVTEVNDGNTHMHDDMPFIVAGRGGGALNTGRLYDLGYRRHGDLWLTLSRAMGDGIDNFGQGGQGVISELLA